MPFLFRGGQGGSVDEKHGIFAAYSASGGGGPRVGFRICLPGL